MVKLIQMQCLQRYLNRKKKNHIYIKVLHNNNNNKTLTFEERINGLSRKKPFKIYVLSWNNKLTLFTLFEVLGVPRIWSTLVYTNSVGTAQKFAKHNWDYGIRYSSVIDKLVRHWICSQHRVFSLSWWYFPIQLERFTEPEKLCTAQRVEGIIFSWCSRGLSLIEKTLIKWISPTKSFCIGR